MESCLALQHARHGIIPKLSIYKASIGRSCHIQTDQAHVQHIHVYIAYTKHSRAYMLFQD